MSASFNRDLPAKPEADLLGRLRAAESANRPFGDDDFVARLERLTRRQVARMSECDMRERST
jgi:hypothetical protein